MGTPEGGLALALFIVLALPGFVYAAVRKRYLGEMPGDRNIGQSIARGIIFSVLLTAAYFLIGGEFLAGKLGITVLGGDVRINDFRLLAFWVVLLYLVVPLLIAFVLHIRHVRWRGVRGTRTERWPLPRSKHGYSGTPTPWDEAIRSNKDCWVTIRKGDGCWVGGWVTDGSTSSSYPEPPSIYINRAYEVDAQGKRGAAKADSALWVLLAEGDVVFWEKPGKDVEERAKEKNTMASDKSIPLVADGGNPGPDMPAPPSVGGGEGGGPKPPPDGS